MTTYVAHKIKLNYNAFQFRNFAVCLCNVQNIFRYIPNNNNTYGTYLHISLFSHLQFDLDLRGSTNTQEALVGADRISLRTTY